MSYHYFHWWMRNRSCLFKVRYLCTYVISNDHPDEVLTFWQLPEGYLYVKQQGIINRLWWKWRLNKFSLIPCLEFPGLESSENLTVFAMSPEIQTSGQLDDWPLNCLWLAYQNRGLGWLAYTFVGTWTQKNIPRSFALKTSDASW